MRHQKSVETLATLANGAELVAAIAFEVLGNEVADTLNGSPITRSVVYNLAQTRFQASLSAKLNGAHNA